MLSCELLINCNKLRVTTYRYGLKEKTFNCADQMILVSTSSGSDASVKIPTQVSYLYTNKLSECATQEKKDCLECNQYIYKKPTNPPTQCAVTVRHQRCVLKNITTGPSPHTTPYCSHLRHISNGNPNTEQWAPFTSFVVNLSSALIDVKISCRFKSSTPLESYLKHSKIL